LTLTFATELPAADRARLDAGEAVVVMGEDGSGTAWRILPSPAERLYRAAGDWRHYDEFFPFVKQSESTTDAAGEVTASQVIDLPFPFADRHFSAELEHGVPNPEASSPRVWTVSWAYRPGSGNVNENRGAWTFTELGPQRTLVELHLVSDAGDAVPASFQRRGLEETLPYALDGLRQQVHRCRYDLPVAATCEEEPPFPDLAATATSASVSAAPTTAAASPAAAPHHR
jgi:ribosome-associated toxin RatA of RatAB toxin-antitoxin module